MASAVVRSILERRKGFAVAAAGHGKTELLGRIVADKQSGRQLVLTHTHAGIAAVKRRLAAMGVPPDKYHLETIAGWCLRFAASYSSISGVQSDSTALPEWDNVYPGAERVCRSGLGKRVIASSYDGVLIDEYQDCSLSQHALVQALSEQLPCRAVGDPLQSIFGFRPDDPVVPWSTVEEHFDVIDQTLDVPWRWRGEGRNAELGDWLLEARSQLEKTQQLVISKDAPVTWLKQPEGSFTEAGRDACIGLKPGREESVIAILKWPNACRDLAKRLGGRWPVVERFDDPDLIRLADCLTQADGPTVVRELAGFVANRMTGVGTDLRTIVDATSSGRGIARIRNHKTHAELLEKLVNEPTPASALAWLEAVLRERNGWWLYRRECVFQLREALSNCGTQDFEVLPEMVAQARTRSRHRGRRHQRKSIGTPLLVKGLEFDHAVLLWEPNHLTAQELYVAITRASKSLTIVSNSRTLRARA